MPDEVSINRNEWTTRRREPRRAVASAKSHLVDIIPYIQGCRSDVRIRGDTKSVLFCFLPVCNSYHAAISLKKYRDTGNHLLCLPFLFICPKQPTARITAYLTAILVNHNVKGLRACIVYSWSYLSPPSNPPRSPTLLTIFQCMGLLYARLDWMNIKNMNQVV